MPTRTLSASIVDILDPFDRFAAERDREAATWQNDVLYIEFGSGDIAILDRTRSTIIVTAGGMWSYCRTVCEMGTTK